MENATLINQKTMINEVNKTIALTDRVKKRKEEYLAARPNIDAKRSRLATESRKETEGEPLDIRNAKLFKKIMEGMPISIREGELIVGSQTQFIRGSGPAIEWRSDWAVDLATSERPSLSGVVKVAMLSAEDKASLLEDAKYWNGKSAADKIRQSLREVFGDLFENLAEARVSLDPIEHGQGGVSVGYDRVIQRGLNGIIADAKERLQKLSAGDFSDKSDVEKMLFLQAVIISCESVIKFAHRYAELARNLAKNEHDINRQKELDKIADICEWVPANPARTFHEAIQSLWFTHLSVGLENCRAYEAVGRTDQYLYPFYKKDIEEERLTRQEAAELLGLLWVKLAEREPSLGKAWSKFGETNMGQLMTIGGVNSDGSDATNELTYMLLEVARQLKTVQPPLYIRCHTGTPEELWIKGAEVLRDRGDGVPAFINDRAVLLNFLSKGIPISEARDYTLTGCVHPRVNYYSTGDGLCVSISTGKILELTLNNGVDPGTGKQLGLATGDPRNFITFNQLYDAYKIQFSYFADLFGRYLRMYWQVRNMYYSLPFISALLGDCIDKGLDLTRGGCRYPQLHDIFQDRGGVQNVADSLAAIKKLVFEEKKITMERLLDALHANFEGDGNKTIQQLLLAAPKYGNDDDYVDEIHNNLSLWQQYRLTEVKTALGLPSRITRGGATSHSYFGKTIGATPDGRKGGTPTADGSLSPMRGVDVKGPTAVIKSASKVNHTEIATSALFNMKILPSVMQTPKGQQKFIALIKTFFDFGGYHIQFNVQGTEKLREAQKHPEQYKDLLVRVAGFSAYFVDLSPALQDEIIARNEHQL